jgi:acetyl esterase/lipase
VLEVHGGAWTGGDRLNNAAIGDHLAAHGIAMLSIDFRMPPVKRYPETVADANYGIRFLKTNAARFATRADLVGGLGTSSGGHLLLLNVLRPRDPRYAALPLAVGLQPTGLTRGADAGLAFAVLCWPVADPLARYRAVRERGNTRLADAHDQFWPSEAAMAEGSPQLILDRGEPVETPPALIMQGTADDNLTADMARDFAAAYRKAGGTISFHEFAGEPHAFIARDPAAPNAQRALRLIADFIHHQTR